MNRCSVTEDRPRQARPLALWGGGLAAILAVAAAGCAKKDVRTGPDPDFQAAMRWRGESKVNPAIDRLLWSGFFYWGQWRLSAPVMVVENGTPAEYHGLVMEIRYLDVEGSHSCRPNGALSLTLWRPNADSSGIEALFYTGPIPATPDDASLGRRRQCPRGGYHQPHLARFPFGPTKPGPGDPPQGSQSVEATAGQVHLSSIDPAVPGPPCTLVSGARYWQPCEERRYGVTIQALMGTDSAPRRLAVGPAVLPGIRLFGRCDQATLGVNCADTLQAAAGLRELERARSSRYLQNTSWAEAAKYLTSYDGVTVFRTEVQVRFPRETPDSTYVRALGEWEATVSHWGGAGTVLVRIPDPGSDPAAYRRALERLRTTAGVTDAWPIRGPVSSVLAPPGAVAARLEDHAGKPLANGTLCQLGPNADATGPWCRRANPAGRVSFDSIPVHDATLHAGCLQPDGRTAIGFDSTVVVVRPGRTIEARFRRAPASCSPAPPER